MTYPALGSVSHGTLRTEDLLPVFTDLLESLDCDDADFIAACRAVTDFESDTADNLMQDMLDRLSGVAPPYCYFGSTEGDGSDFGFWPIGDFQQQIVDDGGIVVSDIADLDTTDLDEGPVLHVNDHGNATLYWYYKDELTLVWSVV